MPGARSIHRSTRSSETSHGSPTVRTRRTTRGNQDQSHDDVDGSSSTSQGFPSKARGNEEMIGRRIAKYHGKTLRHGYVNGYIPPVSGKAEPSWTVRYGEDEGKDEVEEVDGPELERQLDLQQLSLQTAGWDPSPQPAKRGRGRPKKVSSKSSAKGRTTASPKPSGVKKQRSSCISPVPKVTPKGKGTRKTLDGDAVTLCYGAGDKGKRVAKEFPEHGVFTGEVVKVQTDSSGVTLWSVTFEDGDHEDYYQDELEKHIELYSSLSESFAAAQGRNITAEDEAKECDINGNVTAMKKSKGKGKGKGKGGGGGGMSMQQMMVGVGVRKFFNSRNKYYDGKVTKYLPPEGDDDYGDLYHVKYEDDDSEDLDSDELEKGKALYDERYPIVRKEISFPSASKKPGKVVLFGKPLAGSPVCRTITGCRRFQKNP